MARKKQVTVVRENKTGRNTRFQSGAEPEMSRTQFVREIRNGQHPDYHVRRINNTPTPVSNPDGNNKNNLG